MLDPMYKKNDAILTNLNKLNVKLRKSDRLRLACKSKNLYICRTIYLYISTCINLPGLQTGLAKHVQNIPFAAYRTFVTFSVLKKGMTSI